MNAVIEHLTEPKKALLEAKKVLKKNGKIIVWTPLPHADFLLKALSRAKMLGKFEHISYFTKTGLEKLLKEAGYSKVHTKAFVLNVLATAEKVK